MKRYQEFVEFYQKKLQKRVHYLEDYRSRYIKKVRQLMWVSLFIFVVLILVFRFFPNGYAITAVVVTIISLLGYAFQTLVKAGRFLQFNYKKYVLKPAIHFYFNDFEYIDKQRIALAILLESQLFPSYAKYMDGEDFMRFKLDKNQIMFCETEVLRNQYSRIFKGVFITSTFNKYFNSTTFVFPRNSKTFLQRVKRKLSGKYKEVHLENVEFTQHFQTISSNQIEARYILTPLMMDKLILYSEKLDMDVSFSFVENRLYCTIPLSKDLFEPGLFKPMDQEFVLKSLEPVLLFTDIVEDLDLNLRIWTRK